MSAFSRYRQSNLPSLQPERDWPQWLRGVGVAVALIVCTLLSRLLTEQPKLEASFWLPSGLLLAVYLVTTRREWPAMSVAILIGSGVFNLFGGWPLIYWFGAAVTNIASAILGVELIRRWVAPRPTLANVGEWVGVVALGGLVSLLPSATVGAWMVRALGSAAAWREVWTSWYFSDLLGVILIVPLVLAWRGRLDGVWQGPWTARRWEAVGMVGGMVLGVLGMVAYGRELGGAGRYVVLPFVVWAAIRFGPRGVTLVSLVAALIAGWLALRGWGVNLTTLATPQARNAEMQLQLSLMGFFGLIPAIVIAAHRRTEAELREQRNFLKAVFEGELECVMVSGPDGGLLQVNRSSLAVLEVADLAEANATGLVNFVEPEFRERFAELHRRALAGENGALTYPLRGRRGTLRWLETHGTSLRDGDGHVSGILTVTRDITEKRQAEAAQRQSEEQLRLIFDAVADGVVVQDRELGIIRCNAAAERILGLTADQMAGRSSLDPRWRAVREDGQPFPGEEHPAVVALRTGQPVRDVVMGVHLPTGPLRWISINAEPVRDLRSDAPIVVASFSDITARRQLQEQVWQAQKMEVVGQLAGGVAHDFNNILTAMRLNLQLVQMDSFLPADVREPIADLETMTRRAARLTEQLLLFARRRVMKTEHFDFNTGIMQVLSMLRRVLGEPIAIHLHLAPEALWLRADPGMLDQVVMNLCVNARDAMPAGGALTLETTAVEFAAPGLPGASHPQARAGRFACLRVTDTGSGMAPEVLAHLFEPFFTTKDVGKGTGLGLATVHGIVHQHQGWIEVESAVGRGSSFVVYFPLAAPPADASEPASRKPVLSGRGTILFVEDEPAVRDTTATMLRRIGYRVLEASHGPEALGVWQREGPGIDLLLTDLVMPQGMNGLELGETLRRSKPALGIVIISGYTDQIIKGDVGARANFTFVAKPFDFPALAEIIRQTLETDQASAGGTASSRVIVGTS